MENPGKIPVKRHKKAPPGRRGRRIEKSRTRQAPAEPVFFTAADVRAKEKSPERGACPDSVCSDRLSSAGSRGRGHPVWAKEKSPERGARPDSVCSDRLSSAGSRGRGHPIWAKEKSLEHSVRPDSVCSDRLGGAGSRGRGPPIWAKKKSLEREVRPDSVWWSRRRESNPQPQLGKLIFYH